MSDRTGADTGTATATDAVASAAEQVRASASGAYDASKKAASYVGETAAEYPVSTLLGTAAVAFLAGYLSNTLAEIIAVTGRIGRAAGRSALTKSAIVCARRLLVRPRPTQYVTRNARENPISGLLGAAAVVCVLGYFLRNRR